jgi:RNA polymerase sigma factor (sigma-70 family)
MARGYSSSEIFELQSNAIQFKKWSESDEQVDFVKHLKTTSLLAIKEELSEKQMLYFTMYYLNGISIKEIAEMNGVNKSTVSRTITRGKRRLAKVLRYAAPHVMNAPITTRNRRSEDGN